MFIIIPLILILASFAGIIIVVARKRVFLKKLTPEANDAGTDLFTAFFPEVTDKAKSFNWKEYKEIWYLELEKFLRRLRLLSLKIDRMSGSLIKQIRKSTNETKEQIILEEEKKEEKATEIKKEEAVNSMDAMKKEEQRMIIEIAKNPKDGELYKTLGDLYLKMNSLEDAKESYEAAMELDPDNEGLKNKHVKILEKISKLQPQGEGAN